MTQPEAHKNTLEENGISLGKTEKILWHLGRNAVGFQQLRSDSEIFHVSGLTSAGKLPIWSAYKNPCHIHIGS